MILGNLWKYQNRWFSRHLFWTFWRKFLFLLLVVQVGEEKWKTLVNYVKHINFSNSCNMRLLTFGKFNFPPTYISFTNFFFFFLHFFKESLVVFEFLFLLNMKLTICSKIFKKRAVILFQRSIRFSNCIYRGRYNIVTNQEKIRLTTA